MSLATRCTACGTVFRVVQDQLKVSEGWVRCGRCQEVFNALEGLFDLGRGAEAGPEAPGLHPPLGASISGRVPLDPARATQASAEATGEFVSGDATPADTVIESRLPTSQFDSEGPGDGASDAPVTAASSSGDDSDGDSDFADARFNTSLLAADAAAEEEAEAAAEPADLQPPQPAAEPADAAPSLSFIDDAERAERWRRPGVRIATTLASVTLLATLAVQVSLQFHDAIAAHWPALRAPLAALCEAAGCSIEPPRQLDAVSVDSSGLTRANDNADAYRLSLVLRNRADFAVAPPAVELTLTDSNGQLISRRVFAPAEFSAAPVALAALAETPLHLTLATGERISGYTIEIFYP